MRLENYEGKEIRSIDKGLGETIATYMDPDIREDLHADLCGCTPVKFLKAYLERDPEFEELLNQEFDIYVANWGKEGRSDKAATLHLVKRAFWGGIVYDLYFPTEEDAKEYANATDYATYTGPVRMSYKRAEEVINDTQEFLQKEKE